MRALICMLQSVSTVASIIKNLFMYEPHAVMSVVYM